MELESQGAEPGELFKGKNILIVNDVPQLVSSIAETLDALGAKVTIAKTGEAALEFLSEHTTDLVLCDVRMSQMNGAEFLAAFRNTDQTTPVVFLTTCIDIERQAFGIQDQPHISPVVEIQQILRFLSRFVTSETLQADKRELSKDSQVLIVNNNSKVVLALRDVFSGLGMRLQITSSAESAVGLSTQIRFDLIIFDASMPFMTASQFRNELTRRLGNTDIPEILLCHLQTPSEEDAVGTIQSISLDKPPDQVRQEILQLFL